MTNYQPFLKIEQTFSGVRWIVTDIHGCALTLRKLLEEKINLKKEDALFLLGDYIDKGKRSAEVLDYLIDLEKQGYQLFPLRGNHEQNILETSEEFEPRFFRSFVETINKAKGLLTESWEIKPQYRAFFEKLPYYYELPEAFLVHAGFDFRYPNPFQNYPPMLEVRFRLQEFDLSILNGKHVIHGHSVFYREAIEEAINEKKTIIPLDNGCVYTKPHKRIDHTQTGRLYALNLDEFSFVFQENID